MCKLLALLTRTNGPALVSAAAASPSPLGHCQATDSAAHGPQCQRLRKEIQYWPFGWGS
jgi:hypothetical protein